WSWDTEEVLELIEWMRRWNTTHDRKVFFYGYDMQGSAPAAIFLLGYLQEQEPATYGRIKDALQRLAIDVDPNDGASRSERERDAVRVAIADVIATLDARQANTSKERYELGIARLHAMVLRQREQYFTWGSVHDSYAARDRSMAQNIAALLD